MKWHASYGATQELRCIIVYMITKVVSAFPGTGKSYFASSTGQKAKVIDLDSGDYTLGYTEDGKVRNHDFPKNYLAAIKKHIGKTDILFVGCQPEVIAALRDAAITFTLIYPRRRLMNEYLGRFQRRHNQQSFIDLLSKNWDIFLDYLERQKDCEHIVLDAEQYISDVLQAR